MDGTLDVGSETPCPICGNDLGYYAEFGNEIQCDTCGAKLKLTRRTEIDWELTP